MCIIRWLGFSRGGVWMSHTVILKFLKLPKCAIIFLCWHMFFPSLLAPLINDNFGFCYFEMVTLSSSGCPGTFCLNTSELQTCYFLASISWELVLPVCIVKPVYAVLRISVCLLGKHCTDWSICVQPQVNHLPPPPSNELVL